MSTGDAQARSRFQSGLLSWLRSAAPQDHANGLREMIAVTRGLAEAEPSGSGDGLLWRSAGSFLQALLDGSLASDDEAKTLCRRLERHLSAGQVAANNENPASPESSTSSANSDRSGSDESPDRAPNYAPPSSRRDRADALAKAIFAFVSNRMPSPQVDLATSASQSDEADFAETTARDPAANDSVTPTDSAHSPPNGLNTLLKQTLAATADVLPLLGNAKVRRFSDPQLARWKAAVAALRRDWHAVQTGRQADCRAASIALLQLALELADAPSLRLAEAFAEAGGAAEDRAVCKLPAFRAAFSAALELAEHAEGPDQAGFDDSTSALAARLTQSAILPKPGAGLVCASAPWFAEDAYETLNELVAALDAIPPRRLALLSGFDWFAQHESGKAMAIRGLAKTAHAVVGQIRTDDLDTAGTHAIIGEVIAALRRAVRELAGGNPPHADEEVFAQLRGLEAEIRQQRQLAIAKARAAAPNAATSGAAADDAVADETGATPAPAATAPQIDPRLLQ